jgi:uncharacterized cysteine cluster protein YcgN (CxxCxxCC family)
VNTEQTPFWKKKTLHEMTQDEWESLCDHCGICCLEKYQDIDTGEISVSSVPCEYLDTENCQCIIYENRFLLDPECLKITPDNVKQITWLPDTCAYRRIAERRDLEWWHPLVSGNRNTVHRAGISVRGKFGAFLNSRLSCDE